MGKLYVGNSGSTPAVIKVKTKFGASADTWIGDVDENGTLNKPTWTGSLNFAGVKTIGNGALDNMFSGFTGITGVDLSSLETVSEKGLYYAFDGCTSLTSIDLSSLQNIGNNGLEYAFNDCTSITGKLDLSSLQSVSDNGLYRAFYECTGITSVDLSSLQSVGLNGLVRAFYYNTSITSVDLSSLQSVGTRGLYEAFSGCTGLTSVDLSSLQSIGYYSLQNIFDGCTSLTTISFLSLTSVDSTGFGKFSYNYAFKDCTALTEIHFLEFMQATIEAMDGYADKWGATNATIYFDLNNEEFPTINIIASQDVLIEINGKRTNVISAPINTQLTIKAKKEGYGILTLTHVVSESCDIQITDDMFIPIPSEYNINYSNMSDNLLLLSSLVDGSNFIISDELCGIVNGDSSFNKNNGYSSGSLAICPLSDCTLSITCEVSSEGNYDFGAVYVGDSYYTPILADIKNGKVPENIIKLFSGSGIIPPQTYTTQLNANQTYYISFVYAKDSSTNTNKDRMIITEIKTEPISV